jgi:NADPH:quinone reductase
VVAVFALGALSPRRNVLKYQIQRFRDAAQQRDGAGGGEPRYPAWFEEDFRTLVDLLRRGGIQPVVAERLPLAEARHADEILNSSAAKASSWWFPRTA